MTQQRATCSSIVVAIGACLLLYLLGGGGSLLEARAGVVRRIPMNVMAERVQTIDCGRSAYIRIAVATWFGPQCPWRVDRRPHVGSRCDNKHVCQFIPHWNRSGRLLLNLGEVCSGRPKFLTGTADCHDPCHGTNCGTGKCLPTGYASHICQCMPGYMNLAHNRMARCLPDQCRHQPCGPHGTCQYNGTQPRYQCVCKAGYGFEGGTCKELKHLRTFNINVPHNGARSLNCDLPGSLLHVKNMFWGGFLPQCRTLRNATTEIQAKCENQKSCRFVPHVNLHDYLRIRLGTVCPTRIEHLRGVVECWRPCAREQCGAGTCAPLAWNSYKCLCNGGHVNLGATKSGVCVPDPCRSNPCGVGKCETIMGNRSFKCICPVAHKFTEGTCKAFDTCAVTPAPCPPKAICSDGMGKVPTCTCPEHHTMEDKECAAIDLCATNNGDCPEKARCIDGLGKKPTCECEKYHALSKSGKICEPVDQCSVDYGGCHRSALCTDGLGKEATCSCKDYYELEDGKCVDIDECATDNGGCGDYAKCVNAEGVPPTCECYLGDIGDGRTCKKPGRFSLPVNGTIKVVAFDVVSDLTLKMGRCFDLEVSKNGLIRAATKEEKKATTFKSIIFANAYHTVLLIHRAPHGLLVHVVRRGSNLFSGKWQWQSVNLKWDAECTMTEVRLEVQHEAASDPSFYRTVNIVAMKGDDEDLPPEEEPEESDEHP